MEELGLLQSWRGEVEKNENKPFEKFLKNMKCLDLTQILQLAEEKTKSTRTRGNVSDTLQARKQTMPPVLDKITEEDGGVDCKPGEAEDEVLPSTICTTVSSSEYGGVDCKPGEAEDEVLPSTICTTVSSSEDGGVCVSHTATMPVGTALADTSDSFTSDSYTEHSELVDASSRGQPAETNTDSFQRASNEEPSRTCCLSGQPSQCLHNTQPQTYHSRYSTSSHSSNHAGQFEEGTRVFEGGSPDYPRGTFVCRCMKQYCTRPGSHAAHTAHTPGHVAHTLGHTAHTPCQSGAWHTPFYWGADPEDYLPLKRPRTQFCDYWNILDVGNTVPSQWYRSLHQAYSEAMSECHYMYQQAHRYQRGVTPCNTRKRKQTFQVRDYAECSVQPDVL